MTTNPFIEISEQLAELKQQNQLIITKLGAPITESDEFLSPERLQQVTGLKPSYQNQLRHKGLLPFVKIGKKVFYRRPDIQQFINSRLTDGKQLRQDAKIQQFR